MNQSQAYMAVIRTHEDAQAMKRQIETDFNVRCIKPVDAFKLNEPVLSEAVERAAKIVHELNRQYCESIGDDSQVAWEQAPTMLRESARQGILFHALNERTLPSDSHASWLLNKIDQGFLYGDKKDLKALLHPCMVPHSELPDFQKVKDELFCSTAKILIKAFKIEEIIDRVA